MQDAQAECIREEVLSVLGDFHDILDVLQDHPDERDDPFAHGGHDDSASAAFDQLHAEAVLHFAKLCAQGRLRDMATLGGASKM